MSKSASSAAATLRVSAVSRLTPRLMLPALMMVAWRAAASTFASSAGFIPVVPSTCTMRALAASAANSMEAAGTVKSSTASTLANSSRGSSVMTTPSLAEARQQADVLAERDGALLLDGAGQHAVVAGVHGADQLATHATRRTRDGDLHLVPLITPLPHRRRYSNATGAGERALRGSQPWQAIGF